MPRGRRKIYIKDYDHERQTINFKEEAREVKRMEEMGKPPAPGVGLDGKPLANASDMIEDAESLGSLPAKRKGGRPRKVEIAQAKEELGRLLAQKKAAETVAEEMEDAAAEMAAKEAEEKEQLEEAREKREAEIRAGEPVTLDGTEEDFTQQLDELFLLTEIAEAIGTTRKVTHALTKTAGIKPYRIFRGYGYYTAEQARAVKRAYVSQYRRDKAAHVARLKELI